MVYVDLPSDDEADGDIDIYDIMMMTSIYGSKKGDANYDPNADADCNGVIEIYDKVLATSRYGAVNP